MLAILLLPGLSLLLIVMSRIEDTLHEDPQPARHARRSRHLRLVHGSGTAGTGADEPDQRTAAA
ncbi:hypothetical protein AB0O67_23235 [Streptomyces sp. NPDC086077]|uniref:hypothetical protein n=1 Tax=Streptomyces sp. NPDC086077 TaxID=3154862 RepID=UPI00342B8C31